MIGILNNWFTGFKKRHQFSKCSNSASWERHERKGLWMAKIDWYLFKQAKELSLMLGFSNNYAGSYQLRIGIPFLFLVYLRIKSTPNWFTKWVGGDSIMGGRETGFSIGKLINLRLACYTDGWDSKKFNGWSYIKTWQEVLMGSHSHVLTGVRYTTTDGQLKRSKNHPNGLGYVLFHAKIETFRSSYSRWYLFWYHPTYQSITLDPSTEIVVPGKGDNGWDQDDETMGTISFGSHVKTLAQAVGQYMESVERYMRR